MPKEQAMELVQAEYSRRMVKDRSPRDPADIAAQASQLLDDFLVREKVERHVVPTEVRQLLRLLAEGVHVYPEELEIISEYVSSRQNYVQGEPRVKHLHLRASFCALSTMLSSVQSQTWRWTGETPLLQHWGNRLLCFPPRHALYSHSRHL